MPGVYPALMRGGLGRGRGLIIHRMIGAEATLLLLTPYGQYNLLTGLISFKGLMSILTVVNSNQS